MQLEIEVDRFERLPKSKWRVAKKVERMSMQELVV